MESAWEKYRKTFPENSRPEDYTTSARIFKMVNNRVPDTVDDLKRWYTQQDYPVPEALSSENALQAYKSFHGLADNELVTPLVLEQWLADQRTGQPPGSVQ